MELPIRSRNRSVRAHIASAATLEAVEQDNICSLKSVGSCADDKCSKIHGLRRILGMEEAPPSLPAVNTMNRISRESDRSEPEFTSRDTISSPKHDNDHECITKIKILPTTDEIICLSPPAMPEKDAVTTPTEYLDLYFRHMRYDCVEPIIDTCYDGLQRAIWPVKHLGHRFETPRGVFYSLFSDVKFEAIKFHRDGGAEFKIIFECPQSLRGLSLIKSNVFEKQKMCSLLAIHDDLDASTQDINVIHFEVKDRSPTNINPTLTGSLTHASICVCLADKHDISMVRQAMVYAKGLIKARFYLVQMPNTLTAGFIPVLGQLQTFAKQGTFPFAQHTIRNDNNAIPPPSYANNRRWNVSCLKNSNQEASAEHLSFTSMLNEVPNQQAIDNLKTYTTLDDGQAVALYENLSRCLAFTQGPPGTGKTFLGVAEAEVILKSRVQGPGVPSKPIVVICATNHALDDFVLSLIDRGIDKVVRLGTRSTNPNIAPYQLSKVKSRKRLRPQDLQTRRKMLDEHEKLANIAAEWAAELTDGPSFRLLQDYFQCNEPDILREFERLDVSGDLQTELHFLKTSSAVFAFNYWLKGGDLEGLASLLDDGFNVNAGSRSVNRDDSGDPGGLRPRINGILPAEGIVQKDTEALKKSWADTARERKEKQDNIMKRSKEALQKLLNEFQKRSSKKTRTHQIWCMNLEQRRALFETWKQGLDERVLCDAFTELHRRYQNLLERWWDWNARMDAFVIQQLNIEIVAVTATGAARNWQFLYSLKPETYIIEEASEVTEPMTTAALVPSLAHLIKIGDPLQLRPYVTSQIFCTENDTRYRLDESLFERMMKTIPYSKLNVQRRAHSDMADLLRAGDYPYLLDNPSTATHPEIVGLKHRMFWIDHDLMEDLPNPGSPYARSASNKHEALFISALIRYLVQRKGCNGKKITVITPYNGQVATLTKALSTFCKVLLSDEDKDNLISQGLLSASALNAISKATVALNSLVRVTSVDSYQGEENDITFLSTVRSNHKNKTGFLANQNRINVAISRARNGFYIIGNSKLLRTNVEGWRKVIEVFEENGRLGPYLPMLPCAMHQLFATIQIGINNPKDLERLPDCHAQCNTQLDCGHCCSAECHPVDMHTDGRMKCTAPCGRVLKCGHNCPRLCHEECGPCPSPIEQTKLDCGHIATITCSMEIASLQCSEVVREVYGRCGHRVIILCGKTEPEPCKQRCNKGSSCDHRCEKLCGTCNHQDCDQRCGRLLSCGHFCTARCHYWDWRGCPPCQQPCTKTCSHGGCDLRCSEPCLPCIKDAPLSHCQHRKPAVLCGLPASRLPCSEPCRLMARCGLHQCQGLCGEDCPDVCDACDGQIIRENLVALPCGHIFDVKELDARFEIGKLFEMDGINIVKVNMTGLPDQMLLDCPTCGGSLDKCPRYALCEQVFKHEDVIGGLLAGLGRQIWAFMRSINDLYPLLDDVGKTGAAIKSGSLGMHKNHNQEIVTKPLIGIKTLQKEVERYKLGVVKPVSEAVLAYTRMLGKPQNVDGLEALLGPPELPLLLRCDRVLLRCDVIIVKYIVDVRAILSTRKEGDNHLEVFVSKMKEDVVEQLAGKIEQINGNIKDCQNAALKRLEVEYVVQKSLVISILRRLRQETSEMGADLQEAVQTCGTNRAAAVLKDHASNALQNVRSSTICLNLDDASNQKFYTKDGKGPQQLWGLLGKYAAGKLMKCGAGHFYCKSFFEWCPECGLD